MVLAEIDLEPDRTGERETGNRNQVGRRLAVIVVLVFRRSLAGLLRFGSRGPEMPSVKYNH